MATLRGSQATDSMAGSGSTGSSGAGERRPYLEIQYHPDDIRRGVRYLFLSHRQFFGWVLGAAVYLLLLGLGLSITPTVIAHHMDEKEYKQLQVERTREGERLRTMVARLADLETETSSSLTKMSKIHLAYGLPQEGQGQGGYPKEAPDLSNDSRSIYRQEIQRGHELRTNVEGQVEALRVFLGEVRSFEQANDDQIETTPSLSPLRAGTFVMTSPFGTRRSPFTKEVDHHPGLDLAATVGTPIYAPADGTVTFAGRFPLRQSVAWWRYGNLVAMKNGEGFMTLYGHCEDILVKVGQEVRRGQVLATVGNTGWSTNPHLHYEVRRRDPEGQWHPIDPRIYILDYTWTNEERMLIQARKAPSSQNYEPLPRVIGR